MNIRRLGFLSVFTGLALLCLTALGEWTPLGQLASTPARSWEAFEPELVRQASDLDQLYDIAQQRAGEPLNQLHPRDAMAQLFAITNARFTHGSANHTVFSNWILWLGGLLHPDLGVARHPDNLLGHAASALCSGSSTVLMQLTLRAGIAVRHVGLNGHVVMEAWYDDGWHMYDPDYEVVVADAQGELLGLQALSLSAAEIRAAYAGKLGAESSLQTLIDIMTRRDRHSFVAYPPGSQFEWKSQVLLEFERVAGYLKFLLPLLLVLPALLGRQFR